ncbi:MULTISPECIES: hypothetical protein [Streptomyces]|uniref:Lipoprotein n=2 Tax=Streptomyces TaxID=1883 RepID=A0A420V682_9ACTN|nr:MULTISPECIES: hypothetical protein [Streptomyces]KNE81443.1 lipoprotein [Streptomyces fradiae]OFA41359.1 hypothetical protein BEN35_24700 [Streptomyces fradiae]PQM24152.1 hypothetical protein Sfr7A_04960 [Streptomyces xinghaiensis]RKM97117.1 hypothetical protein SFRA_007650 [Streptomyces xinghaiensis]RNC75490.1 hypothetical protein DC095_006950 [Streptomyces xinghaiensis]
MTAHLRTTAAAPRTRYAASVAAVLLGLTAGLTGCSAEEEDPDAGTNGVGKLSAKKIEGRAIKAADAADAVRLSGNVVSKGRTYELDMRLREDGGSGRVTTGSSTFELLRVEKDLYLKADAAFWKSQQEKPSKADAEAAGKLDDKYVKVPPADPAYQQFTGFTDMSVLLDGLLVLHGDRSKGERTEIGGVRAIRVAAGGGTGGTIDVSLEGTPYPLRFQRAGDAGVLRLTDWNKDFGLKAPEKDDIVDYGQEITTE